MDHSPIARAYIDLYGVLLHKLTLEPLEMLQGEEAVASDQFKGEMTPLLTKAVGALRKYREENFDLFTPKFLNNPTSTRVTFPDILVPEAPANDRRAAVEEIHNLLIKEVMDLIANENKSPTESPRDYFLGWLDNLKTVMTTAQPGAAPRLGDIPAVSLHARH